MTTLWLLLLLLDDSSAASSIILVDRRHTFKTLIASSTTLKYPKQPSKADTTATTTNLDEIDWKVPKHVLVSMIRSVKHLDVSGLGSPSYFSHVFVCQEANNVRIKGYEAYCRWMNQRYKINAC